MSRGHTISVIVYNLLKLLSFKHSVHPERAPVWAEKLCKFIVTFNFTINSYNTHQGRETDLGVCQSDTSKSEKQFKGLVWSRPEGGDRGSSAGFLQLRHGQ